MALTDYTLPLVAREFGTYRLTLQVENAGITGVSSQELLSLGEIIESVADIAGLAEVSNLSVTFLEEYATYSIGWWLTVIEELGPYTDDIRLKIELDEGAGYDIIFWGVINRENVRYGSAYISDGKGSTSAYTTKRIVVIEFIDLIALLQTTSMDDVATEANIHAVQYNYQPDTQGGVSVGTQYFFKVTEVIASIVKVAFGQTYAATDCTVANCDIRFSRVLLCLLEELADIYIMAGVGNLGYFASVQTQYYVGNTYKSAFEFLGLLCTTFGVIARRIYTGGRHTIVLSTRGRVGSTFITFPDSPETDDVGLTNTAKPLAVRMLFNDSSDAYQAWTQKDGVISNEEPTEEQSSFDLQFTGKYFVHDTQLADISFELYSLDGSSVMRAELWIEEYDYESAGYALYARFDSAWVDYFFSRFAGWRTISRSFLTLAATESSVLSYDNLAIPKRFQDNDGSGSKNYFVRMTRKNLDTGMTNVEFCSE